jgi:hypothetical protein
MRIYRKSHLGQRISYLLEFENIIDMLTAKEVVKHHNISFEYISHDVFSE